MNPFSSLSATQTMVITHINETSPHLKAVKEIWHANKSTLGFFPEGAFDDYASRRLILVALESSGECVGYLLYRYSETRIVIVHLCVREEFRKQGVAKLLFNNLKTRTSECFGIVLNCRRDFATNEMWPHLGFYPISEKIGRSKSQYLLETWWYDYGKPTLFSITSKAKSRAVLDASVLFDLQDPLSKKTEESKALQSAWLQESIALCLTNEIYHEINRHTNEVERRKRRAFANKFPILNYDYDLALELFNQLSTIFPGKLSPAKRSDLHQLAKAIASNAHFFVTRDQGILNKAGKIFDKWGIKVIRPCELIILTDQVIREVQYRPFRLAGSLIQAKRIQSSQVQEVVSLFQNFERREPKKKFLEKIQSALASPNIYECNLVYGSNGQIIGFFILDRSEQEILKIPILRIKKGPLTDTVARHLIWRAVTLSSEENRYLTTITDEYISDSMESGLHEAYFIQFSQGWIKINLRTIKKCSEVRTYLLDLANNLPDYRNYFDKIRQFLAEASPIISSKSHIEMERLLWPAKIIDGIIPSFIVPIRPRWAMHLFDYDMAANTLFGSDPRLALNVENVYYRASRPYVISAPSRILWYISQEQKCAESMHIRACSYVKEIMTAPPKQVFNRFRQLGIYEWDDIKQIVKGDLEKSVMGFCFSHTELFSQPIQWETLQEILFVKEGKHSQIQSPIKISEQCFIEIYKRGMSIK